VDPAELINEIAQKENMCMEVINMAGFLYEKTVKLEDIQSKLKKKCFTLENENKDFSRQIEVLNVKILRLIKIA